jgi:hypothetical protein
MPTRDPITPDEAFDGLPAQIRAAIEGSGWQEKIRRIAGSRKLRVDQGAALEDETLRFMSGLQSVEEYAVHLAQEIPMPEAEFKAFVAELEREIFVPIQVKIKDALPPADASTTASESLGESEEDDLEALLNEGEKAIADVAATAPKGPVVTPIAAPVSGSIVKAAPAPVALKAEAPIVAAPAATIAVPLAGAAQKLAGAVVKPAETVIGNLQKAPAPAAPAVPAVPKSSDPYREPVL